MHGETIKDVYIGYLLVKLPTTKFTYILISGYLMSEELQRMCLKEAVTYFKLLS